VLLATEHFADLARVIRADRSSDGRIIVLPAETQGMTVEQLRALADTLPARIAAAIGGGAPAGDESA
jgi:hypothetical protein